MKEYPLQALRILPGWTITWNVFYQMDPPPPPAGAYEWGLLTQSLLQIVHSDRKLLIDLGWYPEGSPEGQFILRLLKDQNWDMPIRRFESRDRTTIVSEIESWIQHSASGLLK